MVAAQVQDSVRRILDEDGKLVSGAVAPDLSDEELLKIFDTMLLVRQMDERCMRLQRQGRLSFYMQSIGEEASHMAVHALREDDWLYPSYREQGSLFYRGYTVTDYINQLFGNEKDPTLGRQMPVHHSARWLNIVSISSPVGTQIPQAVGTGMAMRISGTDQVSMVYFGEGTSSTGDFHVAMNFAGVSKAPTIFICRNNGYAISVPLEKQTAAKSFASRAVGYGFPGVRVDGNDVLAVIQVTTEAVERARAGEGPTLIEAVTYRRAAHSSSDDPSGYRDPAEPESWAAKDPLRRLRGYMKTRGLWSEQLEEEVAARHKAEINAALAGLEELGPPPLDTLFRDVYETPPWHLLEQEQWLKSQPRPKPFRH